MLKEYKLSAYQDYGPLENKEHIRLARNKVTGKMCVKKILGKEQREIVDFRRNNDCVCFPKILEVIEEDDQTIIIEEYIEGINLEQYMMGETVPEKEAVKIARQVCEALSLLHHASPMIVYRDLKAENVMITPDRNVKLVDFDISRKYQEGKRRDTRLLGTAEYAAPEQFGYFQTDNRTDIYAFGVLFNYMLTGKFPVEFVTEGIYGEMIRKCTEMEPGKRYQSVDEILELLPNEQEQSKSDQEVQNEFEKKEPFWRIPGFRSRTLWKMLVAVFGYGLILCMGTSIEFTDGQGTILPVGRLWLNRTMFTLAQLATILFNFNYMDMHDKIPIVKKLSPIFKIVLFAISWIVFVVIAIMITSLLENVFFL